MHANLPTCPFCFHAFNDFPSLRKHYELKHQETGNQKPFKPTDGRKRPCRFFRNGKGLCNPNFSGPCTYDHSLVERELCFHKQNCHYKPNCIFFHPEGQEEEEWRENRRKSKLVSLYSKWRNMFAICLQFYSSNH